MLKYVEETINSLNTVLSEKFDDFHGIYLYGVFMDGKPHTDEDIELVAIFDVENKEKRAVLWPIVGKIETDLEVCIDLTPITKEALKADDELYNAVVNFGKFFPAK